LLRFRHCRLLSKVLPDFGLRILNCGLAAAESIEVLRACACWESNNRFGSMPLLFPPSKEVSSNAPSGAPKNPPTASWWSNPRLPRFRPHKIIRNENQTISKQFQADPVEDFSAKLAASRPDARAQHDSVQLHGRMEPGFFEGSICTVLCLTIRRGR